MTNPIPTPIPNPQPPIPNPRASANRANALLDRATNPPSDQAAVDFDIVDAHRALATLGLHGQRLSRQFQKVSENLREKSNTSAATSPAPDAPQRVAPLRTRALPFAPARPARSRTLGERLFRNRGCGGSPKRTPK